MARAHTTDRNHPVQIAVRKAERTRARVRALTDRELVDLREFVEQETARRGLATPEIAARWGYPTPK